MPSSSALPNKPKPLPRDRPIKESDAPAVCDRMLQSTFKYISPTGPYLLRLPPGAPQLKHGNPHWVRGMPFTVDEEEIQYATFRQDTDRSILLHHGDWDDGEGAMAKPQDPSSRPSSSRTPLPNQAPKKKISLADYRNLQKSKPKGDQPKEAGDQNGDVKSAQPSGNEAANGQVKVSGQVEQATPVVAPESTEDSQKKRPREEASSNEALASPAKKPRTTPDATPSSLPAVRLDQKEDPAPESSKAKVIGNGIPKKEVPVKDVPLPEEKNPSALAKPSPPDLDLPPMLSPTLPASIEAELAKLKNGARESKPISSAAARAPQRAEHSQRQEPADQKQSLIVVLKIRSKSNRKQLAQYLKLKPTPKRNNIDTHYAKSSSATEGTKGAANPTPIKRQREEEDVGSKGVAIKKSKPNHTNLQTPATPSTKKDRSPSHLATPASGTKGAAMGRTTSQESDQKHTKAASEATASVSKPSKESPEQKQWVSECNAEGRKYLNLGVEIKHDSDVFLKPSDKANKDKKLGVVIATESILSFILAAVLSNEPCRRYGHDRSTANDLWRTTRTFIANIASNQAQSFPALYGMLRQIEAVACDALQRNLDIRTDSVLRKYSELKAQDTTKADEYMRRHERGLLKDSYEVRCNGRIARREGESALYHKKLAAEFPRTWGKQREEPLPDVKRDHVVLRNYTKYGFVIPLGPSSTGLEVVNFGLAFLEEYCRKEKVEWQKKLKI